jgi:hypothetical protein
VEVGTGIGEEVVNFKGMVLSNRIATVRELD